MEYSEYSYVILRRPGESREYPFGAFFVKDKDVLQERLDAGDLMEGDLVIGIDTFSKVTKQNPLTIFQVDHKIGAG